MGESRDHDRERWAAVRRMLRSRRWRHRLGVLLLVLGLIVHPFLLVPAVALVWSGSRRPLDARDATPARTRPVLRVDPVDGVPAQVLFVRPDGRRHRVDVVLLGPARFGHDDLSAGTPMVLDVALPPDPIVRATAERVLDRWAAEGAVVDLEIRSVAPGPRARLDQGDTRLLLDLVGEPGH